MTDGDSDPDPESVPATTFLPDHLVSGPGPSDQFPDGGAAEPTDDGGESDRDEEGGADAASEFCRSWRSHLSGSSRSF